MPIQDCLAAYKFGLIIFQIILFVPKLEFLWQIAMTDWQIA
jgi:hypothetical protein